MTGSGAVALIGPRPALVRRSRPGSSRSDRRDGSTTCTGGLRPPGRRRRAGTAAASSRAPRRRGRAPRPCAPAPRASPSSAARRGLGLPLRAHRARKSAARGRVLVERLLAVRPVVADRRGAHERARARARRSRRPSTRLRVPVTRLSRIAAFALGVQRCATVSPARCTTASRPASALRRRRFGQRIPRARPPRARSAGARARAAHARWRDRARGRSPERPARAGQPRAPSRSAPSLP